MLAGLSTVTADVATSHAEARCSAGAPVLSGSTVLTHLTVNGSPVAVGTGEIRINLLLGVLHGGGLIFPSQTDPNAKIIQYWISHPAPLGQDEFSTASYSMFTPPDPTVGTCNTQ